MNNWDWVSRCPRCGTAAPVAAPAVVAPAVVAPATVPAPAAHAVPPAARTPSEARADPPHLETAAVKAILTPTPVPFELRVTNGPRKLAASATIIVVGIAAGWSLSDPLAPLLLETRRWLAPAGPWATSFLLPFALFLMLRVALLPRMLTHPRVDRQTFVVTPWYEAAGTTGTYFWDWASLPYHLERAVKAARGNSLFWVWLKDSLSALSPFRVSPHMVRAGLLLSLADAAVLTSYVKAMGPLASVDRGVPLVRTLALVAAIPLGQVVIAAIVVLSSRVPYRTRPGFMKDLELAQGYWYLVTFTLVFQLPLYLVDAILFRQLPSLAAPIFMAQAVALTTFLAAHGLSVALARRDNRWLQRVLPEVVAAANDGDLEARRSAIRRLARLPEASSDAAVAGTFTRALTAADPETRAAAEGGLGISLAAREFLEVCGLTARSTLADVQAAFGRGVRGDRALRGDEKWTFVDGAVEVEVIGPPGQRHLRSVSINDQRESPRLSIWLRSSRLDVINTLGVPSSWSNDRRHFTYGIPGESGKRAGSVNLHFYRKRDECSGLTVVWS